MSWSTLYTHFKYKVSEINRLHITSSQQCQSNTYESGQAGMVDSLELAVESRNLHGADPSLFIKKQNNC